MRAQFTYNNSGKKPLAIITWNSKKQSKPLKKKGIIKFIYFINVLKWASEIAHFKHDIVSWSGSWFLNNIASLCWSYFTYLLELGLGLWNLPSHLIYIFINIEWTLFLKFKFIFRHLIVMLIFSVKASTSSFSMFS